MGIYHSRPISGSGSIPVEVLGNATEENPVLARNDPAVSALVLSLGAESVAATEEVAGASLTGGAATVSDSGTGNTIEIHPNDGITANTNQITLNHLAAIAGNVGLSSLNTVLGIGDLLAALGTMENHTEVLWNNMGGGVGESAIKSSASFTWDEDSKQLTIRGKIHLESPIGETEETGNILVNTLAPMLTTGESNILVGGAGAAVTEGSRNVVLGGDAFASEDTGSDNIVLGAGAANQQTGIFGTVAIGTDALSWNTAAGCFAIGFEALREHTTGAYSMGLGYQAGKYQTGEGVLAIGYQALLGVEGSSTGSTNIAIGNGVFKGMTTGTVNLGIGDNVGEALTTSEKNTLIGINVMANSTSSSSENVMIGNNIADVYGGNRSWNVFVGYGAGHGDAGGLSNTVVGHGAGAGSGALVECVAIGRGAINRNSDSTGAVAVGAYSCEKSATVVGRTAVGTATGCNNTGNNNTFVGYNSGLGVEGSSTGGNNTTLGFETLKALTSGAGNCVGGYQGMNALTTGDSNTSWGSQAGIKANGDSDGNIFLGYMAGPSSAAAIDNALYIHNAEGAPTIYGDLANKYVGFGGIEDPASPVDINGILTLRATTEPEESPATDSVYLYLTASGTSPSKDLSIWAKFEDGSAEIIKTVTV